MQIGWGGEIGSSMTIRRSQHQNDLASHRRKFLLEVVMRLARSLAVVCAGMGCLVVVAAPALAADWPQYMRQASHTGDAADEQLRLPLAIEGQIPLDDA